MKGNFIGKWTGSNQSIEFYFNGQAKWIVNDVEQNYYFRIKDDKITFIALDNVGKDNKGIIYKFKFQNNYLLLENKTNKFKFNLIESLSEM